MTDLVKLENNKPVTTSLIIAKGVEKDHHSIIKLIRRYEKDLKEFGTFRLEVQKSKGRPLEYALLNEEQTTFLITLMRNNKVVIEFKKKLVKEFYKMKNILSDVLARQQNEEWKEIRESGKITRKYQTDVIKSFVEYATEQGSKNAKMYYANITNMENKALFLVKEKFPNLRNVLTGQQLSVLTAADIAIQTAIKEGMYKKLHYKTIYQLAKQRMEDFENLIPKTTVPMIEVLDNK